LIRADGHLPDRDHSNRDPHDDDAATLPRDVARLEPLARPATFSPCSCACLWRGSC